MDWCRLQTDYYLDAAILRAGEPAEVLFLRCIAYSGAMETRGRIPRHVLPMLTPTRTTARVKALLEVNLLVEDGEDLLIRSWSRIQESLDAEAERRRRDRERKAAERSAKKSTDVSMDSSADSPRTVQAKTPRKEVEVEEEKDKDTAARAADLPREDVERLCAYFVAALERNDVKANITAKWRTEARLMLDRDKRDPHEIRAVIDWATTDSFWRANVLSVPTLREKFDRLRLAMGSNGGRRPVGSGIASQPDAAYLAGGIFSDAMKRRRAREAGETA